eukprot:4533868-Prymnesium_polylepis.2
MSQRSMNGSVNLQCELACRLQRPHTEKLDRPHHVRRELAMRARSSSSPASYWGAMRLPASREDSSFYVCIEAEPLDGKCPPPIWKPAFDALETLALESVRERLPRAVVASRTFVDPTEDGGSRAIQLTRFKSEEALCVAYRALIGRSHCTSEAQWGAVERVLGAFAAVNVLTSFVILGPLGGRALDLLTSATERWGWPPPIVLRTPQPAWLNRLLHTGEAVAFLSLTANVAAEREAPAVGHSVPYIVRGRKGDGVVKLSEPFEYVVDAVFGDDAKGRVVVLRSLHEPGCWLFAFRGVRVGEGRGFELDKEALLQRDVQLPEWLRGASRLETSVDEGCHVGTLDYFDGVLSAGLDEWLAARAVAAEAAHADAPTRLLFLGISMGGALAQMAALYASHVHPALDAAVHSLAFGGTPWATAGVGAMFESVFGRRAVLMVTTRTVHGVERRASRRSQAPWHIEDGGSILAIDPLSCSQARFRAVGCAVLRDVKDYDLLPEILNGVDGDKHLDGTGDGGHRDDHHPSDEQGGGRDGDGCGDGERDGAHSSSDERDGSLDVADAGGSVILPSRGTSAREDAREEALDEGSAGSAGSAASSASQETELEQLLNVSRTAHALGGRRREGMLAHIHHQIRIEDATITEYWLGLMLPIHPFAYDVSQLHLGRHYRSMLCGEHLRFRTYASRVVPPPLHRTVMATSAKGEEGEEGGSWAADEANAALHAVLTMAPGRLAYALWVDDAWDDFVTSVEFDKSEPGSPASPLSPFKMRAGSSEEDVFGML